MKLQFDRIAKAVTEFFKDNAGVGNTRTVLDGATNTRATVIVMDDDAKNRRYRNMAARQIVTLKDVESGALNARNGFPLVFDNAALVALLDGLVAKPKPKRKSKPKTKDV